jgi:DNA-binding SARP family transcriptional activator/TolB-like protein/Tfp pilus assembly protein PilF
MPRASTTCLRLLGTFTVEVNVGRPIAVALRSKKARALLAYLAMKPDWRASREELATLLWGDTPDAQARHSLRQCLMSLRQDLHLAPDLFDLGRDTVELRAQALGVDARELAALAATGDGGDLDRAAELWRGPFLADLTLDLEEFDAWREREQDRLAAIAARVFEAQCAAEDADGDGERALAVAERLVALDPTREDRQRTALKMIARHRGRDAALERARQLTALLRAELAVAPDAATRALVEEIRKGEIAPALGLLPAPRRGEGGERSEPGEGISESRPKLIEPLTPTRLRPGATAGQALSPSSAEALAKADAGRGSADALPVALSSTPPAVAHSKVAFWRRRPMAAALATLSLIAITAGAALALVTGAPLPWRAPVGTTAAQPWLASAIVLPFSADGEARNPALAGLLAHDLNAHLARYGELRMISDRTADLYRDRDVDLVRLGTELDVRYAIVGRVLEGDGELRTSIQLVDTATRATLWSDTVRRETGEPARLADEMARGLARMIDLNIVYAEARQLRPRDPDHPPPLRDLLLRARVAEMHSYLRENVAAAQRLYEEALKRAPHNGAAMLGVARTNIVASMNFLDPDTPPDLQRAESLLTEVLRRYPNWAMAHFTLGLLQKHRRQQAASLQSFQRAIELSPTFLNAQGQVGLLLTRMGQPEKGLEAIRAAIRVATPNDPGNGMLYLFAAEAELELGHQQAALDWALRAGSFMPGSALAQAWIASIYADMGDQANAAKYVAASKTISPAYARQLADRKMVPRAQQKEHPRTRLLEGLRIAFAGTLG